MTRRIVRALTHPRTTMLGHPSGRLLLERQPSEAHWEQVFAAAQEQRTVIEFNTAPARLDLDWRLMRSATGRGIQIAVNPDAHRMKTVPSVFSGIDTARKGWLTAAQVLNTRTVNEVKEHFHARRP
jgi:DNA polymerase (family 10)